MLDPYLRSKRRTSAEKAIAALRHGMVVSGLCVLGAVLSSVLTEPIAGLIGQPPIRANLIVKAVAIIINALLFIVASLLPITLMAAGIGWPIATYLRYSAWVTDQKRRFGGREPRQMPLRKARFLTAGVVAGLLVFGVAGIWSLKPVDTTADGLQGKRIEAPVTERGFQ